MNKYQYKMLKRLYIVLVVTITMFLLVVGVHADSTTSVYQDKYFQQNTKINEVIPCINNGGVCSNAASCNFTIQYPNSTYMVNFQPMSMSNGDANYTLPDASVAGIFATKVVCNDTGLSGTATFNTIITPTGKALTTSQSITYIVIFIISLLIFVGLLLIGIFMPYKNARDQLTGYILSVELLKYVKFFSLMFAYLVALFVAFFAYTVSYSYLDFAYIATLSYFIFYGLAIGCLIFFPLMIYFLITNWMQDSKVSDLLNRGLRVR